MGHTCDYKPENARIFTQEDKEQSILELTEQGLTATGTTFDKTTNKMQTAIWFCPYCGESV